MEFILRLDADGLPVQADGDRNDQLQRCAMIAQAAALDANARGPVAETCVRAMRTVLQPSPGRYVRFKDGDPQTVSGDQLLSALAAWVSLGEFTQAGWLSFRILFRFGFAQNIRDGLGPRSGPKIPDFILLRGLPLFWRSNVYLFILRWLLFLGACWQIVLGHPLFASAFLLTTDLPLFLLAMAAVGPVWKDDQGFARRSPEDVDDNLTVMTLAACHFYRSRRWRTPMGLLAVRAFGRFRPENFGSLGSDDIHPVLGALRWYHRAESGGSPMIAELWRPICVRLFERGGTFS